MTQEDKELLLKDLSARLPYGVVIQITSDGGIVEASYDMRLDARLLADFLHSEDDFKPYLRPMSLMTEEEEAEICGLIDNYEALYGIDKCTVFCSEITDWLNAHHFDYRGLIEKGLAIEAPEGVYKINRNKL